jgi:hypothetical protein
MNLEQETLSLTPSESKKMKERKEKIKEKTSRQIQKEFLDQLNIYQDFD